MSSYHHDPYKIAAQTVELAASTSGDGNGLESSCASGGPVVVVRSGRGSAETSLLNLSGVVLERKSSRGRQSSSQFSAGSEVCRSAVTRPLAGPPPMPLDLYSPPSTTASEGNGSGSPVGRPGPPCAAPIHHHHHHHYVSPCGRPAMYEEASPPSTHSTGACILPSPPTLTCRTLFLSEVPLDVSHGEALFPSVPPHGLASLRVKTVQGRHCGFVEYATPEDARRALRWFSNVHMLREIVLMSDVGAETLQQQRRGLAPAPRPWAAPAALPPPGPLSLLRYQEYMEVQDNVVLSTRLLRFSAVLCAEWSTSTPAFRPSTTPPAPSPAPHHTTSFQSCCGPPLGPLAWAPPPYPAPMVEEPIRTIFLRLTRNFKHLLPPCARGGRRWPPDGGGAPMVVSERERHLFARVERVLSEAYLRSTYPGVVRYKSFLEPPYCGGCFILFVSVDCAQRCVASLTAEESLMAVLNVSYANSNSLTSMRA